MRLRIPYRCVEPPQKAPIQRIDEILLSRNCLRSDNGIFSENIILQCGIDLRLSYFGVKSDGNLGTFVFCSYGVWFCIFHKPSEHTGFENFSQNNYKKNTKNHMLFDQKSPIFQIYTAQSRQNPFFVSAPKMDLSVPFIGGGTFFFPYGETWL